MASGLEMSRGVRAYISRRASAPGVGLQDALDAVAVVDVPVEDQDAAQTRRHRRQRADGHVVEQAEPHGALALRVVPRRPHDRKRAPHVARHHPLDGLLIKIAVGTWGSQTKGWHQTDRRLRENY